MSIEGDKYKRIKKSNLSLKLTVPHDGINLDKQRISNVSFIVLLLPLRSSNEFA